MRFRSLGADAEHLLSIDNGAGQPVCADTAYRRRLRPVRAARGAASPRSDNQRVLLLGTVMASNRRIGGEDSESRAALLDATERLMLEEGYAAVSSRRVAQAAGLKPQLVH